jgi:hypothetical protein
MGIALPADALDTALLMAEKGSLSHLWSSCIVFTRLMHIGMAAYPGISHCTDYSTDML